MNGLYTAWALLEERWPAVEADIDRALSAHQANAASVEAEADAEPWIPEAVLTLAGTPLEGTRTALVRDGVATLVINGPILQHESWLTRWLGYASTERIHADFLTAIESPSVRSLVLYIDSPGGEAFGINALAGSIAAARGRKPITAYVSGMAASAGYWIASAADRIVADANALLGSIGVALPVTHYKSPYRHEFVSEQSPNKRPDPTTPEGKAQFQKLVNDMADVFVGTVARNRGVTPEQVVTRYGGGAVLVGAQAVEAGLADRLGSFQQVMAEMAGTLPPRVVLAAGRVPALSARQGVEVAMQNRGILARLVAALGLSQDEARDEAAAILTANGGSPAAAPQVPLVMVAPTAAAPATPSQSGPSAREQELERELRSQRERADRLAAEARERQREQFLASLTSDRRIISAERDAVAALYDLAAEDDVARPLQTGSRVESLRAAYTARPQHRHTEEVVAGGRELDSLPSRSDDIERDQAATKRWAERNNFGRKPKA